MISPIQTGGWGSPVMPDISFQPVAAFGNPGASQAQGMAQGMGLGLQSSGQILQAQSLAQQAKAEADQNAIAMANAQRLAAMAPIDMQEAQLRMNQMRREQIKPLDEDLGSEVKNIPRQGIDPTTIPAGEPVPYDQVIIHHKRDLVTGQLKDEAVAGTPWETISKEAAQTQAMLETARAATLRAKQSGGGRPEIMPGPDGKAWYYAKQYNPNTDQLEWNPIGPAPVAQSKIDLNASHQGHLEGLTKQLGSKTAATKAEEAGNIEFIKYTAAQAADAGIPIAIWKQMSSYGPDAKNIMNKNTRPQIYGLPGDDGQKAFKDLIVKATADVQNGSSTVGAPTVNAQSSAPKVKVDSTGKPLVPGKTYATGGKTYLWDGSNMVLQQ